MASSPPDSDPLGASLSIHVVRSILWGATQRDLDAGGFMRAAGVTPERLADPDARPEGPVLWYTARELGYAVPYHAMEFAFAC